MLESSLCSRILKKEKRLDSNRNKGTDAFRTRSCLTCGALSTQDTCTIVWMRPHNMNVMSRKHQTKPNQRTLCEVTVFLKNKARPSNSSRFRGLLNTACHMIRLYTEEKHAIKDIAGTHNAKDCIHIKLPKPDDDHSRHDLCLRKQALKY